MSDDHQPPIDDRGDDLEGVETIMSRLASRGARWIAAALALVLVVPVGGWLLDELTFRARGGDIEEALGELAGAVHLVRAVGCDGGQRSGSAFVATAAEGLVLVTNRHVVEDVRALSVRSVTSGVAVEVVGVRLADGPDVAVLEVAGGQTLPDPLSLGDRPQAGDVVRLLGFPAARPFVTSGEVGEVAPAQVLLDLRVEPGASGSPVVSDDGTVVAQVFARTSDGRGIATPAAVVTDAMRSAESAPLGC